MGTLGPVREGIGIKTAIAALERDSRDCLGAEWLSDLQSRTYNRDRMEAIEVPLMVKTAHLVARAASERQESRGSHYRTDFPLRDDSRWLRNLVVKKEAAEAGYKRQGIA